MFVSHAPQANTHPAMIGVELGCGLVVGIRTDGLGVLGARRDHMLLDRRNHRPLDRRGHKPLDRKRSHHRSIISLPLLLWRRQAASGKMLPDAFHGRGNNTEPCLMKATRLAPKWLRTSPGANRKKHIPRPELGHCTYTGVQNLAVSEFNVLATEVKWKCRIRLRTTITETLWALS